MSLPRSKPRFDSLAQEAFLNLWRTYDRLRWLESRLFEEHGLTAQQYNVLRLLQAAYPQACPTLSLAQRLVSSAPDITRIIDKLEESGWLDRQRNEHDRRSVMIRITPKGLALLKALQKPLQRCHEQQLGHLSIHQLQQLTHLLQLAREPHEPAHSPWKPQMHGA